MRAYKPRRASARWLDGDCPSGVLAIFDHPTEFERYTIFYTEPVTGDTYANTHLAYLGTAADPQGLSGHGEMAAWRVADYRRRNHHRSATWSSLPEEVKAVVRRDLTTT